MSVMQVVFCSEEQVILSLIRSGFRPRSWYIVSAPIAITAEKKSLKTTYVLKMLKPVTPVPRGPIPKSCFPCVSDNLWISFPVASVGC